MVKYILCLLWWCMRIVIPAFLAACGARLNDIKVHGHWAVFWVICLFRSGWNPQWWKLCAGQGVFPTLRDHILDPIPMKYLGYASVFHVDSFHVFCSHIRETPVSLHCARFRNRVIKPFYKLPQLIRRTENALLSTDTNNAVWRGKRATADGSLLSASINNRGVVARTYILLQWRHAWYKYILFTWHAMSLKFTM